MTRRMAPADPVLSAANTISPHPAHGFDSPSSSGDERVAGQCGYCSLRRALWGAMESATHTAPPSVEATEAIPSPGVDAILRGAVELARAAVVEFSGETVGEYLG